MDTHPSFLGLPKDNSWKRHRLYHSRGAEPQCCTVAAHGLITFYRLLLSSGSHSLHWLAFSSRLIPSNAFTLKTLSQLLLPWESKQGIDGQSLEASWKSIIPQQNRSIPRRWVHAGLSLPRGERDSGRRDLSVEAGVERSGELLSQDDADWMGTWSTCYWYHIIKGFSCLGAGKLW